MKTAGDDDVCREETRAEVDALMLDYVLCAAVSAILHERIADRDGAAPAGFQGCDRWLEITEATLHLFRTGGTELAGDLRLKLQTLNFTNLVLRRFKRTAYLPGARALGVQRRKSRERARQRPSTGDHPSTDDGSAASVVNISISAEDVRENRRNYLSHMGVDTTEEDDTEYTFSEHTVTLLDILPELMDLRDAVPASLRRDFGNLAALFMLQAALEQGLLYGRTGREVLDECFAWGSGADDAGWLRARDRCRETLQPRADRGRYADYLRRLVCEYPPYDFEAMVIGLVKNLQRAWREPVLSQLEQGRLFSLSSEEVAAFKRRVNIS